MPNYAKGFSTWLRHLRKNAEAELAHSPRDEVLLPSDAALLHELEVHKIELEMQNEALRQTQVVLEESRDRYADLYEFAPVGYLTLSRTGQIAAINLTGATLMGEDRAKLLRRRFASFVGTEDQDRWQRHFLHVFQHGGKQVCELGLQRRDGTVFAVSLDCVRTEAGDEMPMLRITLTDVTDHRQALAQLRTANERLESLSAEQAAHLRQIAGELTFAEQGERDRLYERLHNDVQPLLVATRLSLSGLSTRTPQPECLLVAQKACAHIGEVIQMARTLSHQLNPPLIRKHGLIAALESLCLWVKDNHGLEVDLTGATEADPDDLALRLLCFNAVRELLMNVVKYSGMTRVTLTLQLVDCDTLRITVGDHGNGFNPAIVTNGSGLAWIKRRLGMVGGSLQIDSRPGHGTVATLSTPLQPITVTEGRPGSVQDYGRTRC